MGLRRLMPEVRQRQPVDHLNGIAPFGEQSTLQIGIREVEPHRRIESALRDKRFGAYRQTPAFEELCRGKLRQHQLWQRLLPALCRAGQQYGSLPQRGQQSRQPRAGGHDIVVEEHQEFGIHPLPTDLRSGIPGLSHTAVAMLRDNRHLLPARPLQFPTILPIGAAIIDDKHRRLGMSRSQRGDAELRQCRLSVLSNDDSDGSCRGIPAHPQSPLSRLTSGCATRRRSRFTPGPKSRL